MMTTAESDFRMGEAKITLNTLGGEPIIDHAREDEASDAIVVIAKQTIDATIHEIRERHSLLQYRDDEEQQQQQNQNRS